MSEANDLINVVDDLPAKLDEAGDRLRDHVHRKPYDWIAAALHERRKRRHRDKQLLVIRQLDGPLDGLADLAAAGVESAHLHRPRQRVDAPGQVVDFLKLVAVEHYIRHRHQRPPL